MLALIFVKNKKFFTNIFLNRVERWLDIQPFNLFKVLFRKTGSFVNLENEENKSGLFGTNLNHISFIPFTTGFQVTLILTYYRSLN